MAKPTAGERDCAIAQLMNQVVVAAAAGNRTEFSCPIESLENNAGIISEPAHDREIDFDEFCQAALREVAHQLIELLAPSASIENFENWRGQWSQPFSGFLPRFAFAFVDHLEQLAPAIFGYILRPEQIGPKFAVAQPDDYVIRGKSKGAQQIDRERNQFDIRRGRSVADDVAVELIMLAQPAALLFFVAETLGDGEPLERFAEFSFVRCATTRARVGVSSGRIATSRSPLSVKLKSCATISGPLFFCKARSARG